MEYRIRRKDKLIELIQNKGFTAEEIGVKIGISGKKLLKKLNGYDELNVDEVLKLYCILGIRAEEADSYFFPNYCETLNN